MLLTDVLDGVVPGVWGREAGGELGALRPSPPNSLGIEAGVINAVPSGTASNDLLLPNVTSLAWPGAPGSDTIHPFLVNMPGRMGTSGAGIWYAGLSALPNELKPPEPMLTEEEEIACED